MNKCNRCSHFGHLPHFCPVDPIERGQDPPNHISAVNVSQVHPELLRKTQTDACLHVLRLLDHYSKEQIVASFSRPVLPPLQTAVAAVPNKPPQGQLDSGNGHAHHRQDDPQGHPPAVVPYDSPFERKQVGQNIKPDDPNSSPNVPPTPNSPVGQQVDPNAGGQANQPNVEDGNSAKTQVQQDTGGTKTKRKTSATKNKVTKPKTQRRAPQPRCADCKKRHKRCDHVVQTLDIGDVSGTSQSPQPVQTANDKVAAAKDGEDQTGTPGPMEGTPTEFATQAGQTEAITQQQQDALRSAATDMPTFAHDMRAQSNPQYEGDFGQNNWMYNSTQHVMPGQHGLDTLAPAAENQNANTMASFMGFTDQGGHVTGFRPQTHIAESNGHAFVHNGQHANDKDTNTFNFEQMLGQEHDSARNGHGNQQVVAPNHHSSAGDIFAFDDNGQVVGSIEQEPDQLGAAEGGKGSAGGRKPGEYLRALMWANRELTNFPEADKMGN